MANEPSEEKVFNKHTTNAYVVGACSGLCFGVVLSIVIFWSCHSTEAFLKWLGVLSGLLSAVAASMATFYVVHTLKINTKTLQAAVKSNEFQEEAVNVQIENLAQENRHFKAQNRPKIIYNRKDEGDYYTVNLHNLGRGLAVSIKLEIEIFVYEIIKIDAGIWTQSYIDMGLDPIHLYLPSLKPDAVHTFEFKLPSYLSSPDFDYNIQIKLTYKSDVTGEVYN